MWQWIRNQVKLAVLAGVNDALQELDGTATDTSADDAQALRLRLAPPEPLDTEPRGNGRKRVTT